MDRLQSASLPLIESACPHVGILSFNLELPTILQLRPGLDLSKQCRTNALASSIWGDSNVLKPRDEPTEMDTGERPGAKHRRPRPTGRRPLPASLPRQRIEIDVSEADQRCACGAAKTRIGEAVSEKLDYVPASVRVIETVRLKYACPRCHDGVTAAPAPPQAVERSLATEGLLAHVVVSKYLDHLPLYRLERIFQREHL